MIIFNNSFGAYLVGLVVVLLTIFYLHFKHKYTYWSRKGVPYLPPTVPFGNTLQTVILKKSCHEILSEAYQHFKDTGQKYGGLYLFENPIFIPVDVELIKSIVYRDFNSFSDRSSFNHDGDILSGNLFGAKGDKWRFLRRKLTPAFTSGNMKIMFPTLQVCSKHLENTMRISARNREPVDIKDILSRFTIDVICAAAFGMRSDSLLNPDSEIIHFGKMAFGSTFSDNIRNLCHIAMPGLLTLLNIPTANADTIKFFSNLFKRNVEYRESNDIERNDFLNLLIKLKNKKNAKENEQIKEDTNLNYQFTFDEITSQSLAFIFGGFETTASTISYCIYELTVYPEIQTRLREEIFETLKQHNNEITYDTLMEMDYLDKVIKETTRKYPIATFLNRKCVQDYKIPGTDLVLEKGTDIFVSALGVQYDPEYYPDPTKFDPERFNKENITQRPAYTYLGFGEGPRICIGKRFGIMEAKLALATLLTKFHFTLNKKTVLPLVMDPALPFLAFKSTIWLNCEEINVC